jgi:anti-sigma factor RsiW
VPNLTEQGYELVGGRLLPADEGARRSSCSRARRRADHALRRRARCEGRPAAGETAFRYTSEGGVASFYWVDQGFGYALTGKTPRARLLVLADVVYRQL